jgi:DNA-binding transcriptional LysR family regulator
VDLWDLKVFLAVANERSFSRAAVKLFRTQPAISQAIRKLESGLGEQLFDRRTCELTKAGELLQQRAVRVVQLADEAEAVVRQLREPARKVVTIGANEPSVQALLPIVAQCRQRQPDIGFDVRRTQARRVGAEVLAGTLDFGVLVSQEVAPGLKAITIGLDELDVLLHPSHPLAGRSRITMEEFHEQTIVIHNDPSPARDRFIRLFAERELPITKAMISLPSLDAIKQAVEMQLGVTLLPRRAAIEELAEGRLVAVPLADVSEPRALRLAYRRDAELTAPAALFLEVASAMARRSPDNRTPPRALRVAGGDGKNG